MENTTPVKKVQYREGDIYYVYDKRINKCANEGCCGTVKYGLNIKVHMPNGDTLNTFECNTCHMKYTAYPNYVRLNERRHLIIFNREEVRTKDRKRRDDARKQAKNAKYKRTFKNGKVSNKVSTIGGYQKRFRPYYSDDKRIAATD